MRTEHPKIAKIFTDCANKAKSGTNICMHPNCNEKAINSHIMQKNGILSSIADDKHLWESSIDHFKQEYTRLHRKGINKIYNEKYYNRLYADNKLLLISQIEKSIISVASFWETAWILSGEPTLPKN